MEDVIAGSGEGSSSKIDSTPTVGPTCLEKIRYGKYLVRHMWNVRNGTELFCDICHTPYPCMTMDTTDASKKICGSGNRSDDVKTDRSTEETRDKLAHGCNICGRRFSRSGYLKMHERSHKPPAKKYSCKFCCRVLPSKRSVFLHVRLCGKKAPKRLECMFCTKRYSSDIGLQQHKEMVHHGEKNYLCLYCSKRLSSRQNLLRHLKDIHKKKSWRTPLPSEK